MLRLFSLLISLSSCYSLFAQNETIILPLREGPKEVLMLGENSISTFMNERDFALSPDGNDLYYTISTPKSSFQSIVFCKKIKDDVWTKPEIISFAGEFSDLEPAFSPDGKTLFFSSNRPLTGNTPKDFDIWKVERSGNGWGKPVNLGIPINTQEDEFYPSIAKNKTLYFTAAYKADGVGNEDIYKSSYENNVYLKPVALDTAVNSKFYEFNAFVAPDEQYIIFSSYGRIDDMGGSDLYISVRDSNGHWQPAKNMKAINSPQLDYCPFVSQNDKILFFTSERHQMPVSFLQPKASYIRVLNTYNNVLNGTGNIYWIDFQMLLKLVK